MVTFSKDLHFDEAAFTLNIAIQDATYKVASGEMTAENYWCCYVPEGLITIQEFRKAVEKRVAFMER